jgi:hypothetical protein
VTLAPSGLVFARAGIAMTDLRTTTGRKAEIGLMAVLLDGSGNYVQPQPVAGGTSLHAKIASSDPAVGGAAEPQVTIAGGAAGSTVEFQPAGPGTTMLSVIAPAGFSASAQFGSVTATVSLPGIAVTDGVAVGQNLQVEGAVSLGEPAPAGGLDLRLGSDKPEALLLSASAAEVGAGSVVLRMPAGATSARYYLQAVGNRDTVAVTATAPGYRPRTGTIVLAPSGVVIGGPPGPPDEAELFRKEAADSPHGFLARLSERPVPLLIYAVQLDPATGRSADLTVQPLRAGVSITASLQSSNPAIGKLHASSLTIASGSHTAVTEFTPLSLGSTVISVTTPQGFVKSANATELTVVVER